MRNTLLIVEINIDPSAPWRDYMRATDCDGGWDLRLPYHSELSIGETITVIIEPTKEPE